MTAFRFAVALVAFASLGLATPTPEKRSLSPERRTPGGSGGSSSNWNQNWNPTCPPSYVDLDYLGDAAINAPLTCWGVNTYLTEVTFYPTNWEMNSAAIADCANACSGVKGCEFFNTYLLLDDGVPCGQTCALYTQAWSSTYATNVGQYRGSDHYTIAWSYTAQLPGCEVAQGENCDAW